MNGKCLCVLAQLNHYKAMFGNIKSHWLDKIDVIKFLIFFLILNINQININFNDYFDQISGILDFALILYLSTLILFWSYFFNKNLL